MSDFNNFLASLGLGIPANPQAAGLIDPNNPAPAPIAPEPVTQQPGLNVLQQLGAGGPPQVQQAPQAPEPRARHSLIDIIGGIADAVGEAGGAGAGYRPAIDAQLARANAAEDRTRALHTGGLNDQLIEQNIASRRADQGKDEATAAETAAKTNAGRYGAALRGLQAIQKGGGNLAAAWPILSAQAGLSPQDAQKLGELITSNPEALDGLAAEYEKAHTGGSGAGEFGLTPFVTTDDKGNTKAYQLSKGGGIQEIAVPEGFHPSTQIMQVDQGGQITAVDKRTGMPMRIYAKSTTPEGDANRNEKRFEFENPVPKPKAGESQTANHAAALGSYSKARTGLLTLVHSLTDLASDPGLHSATGMSGEVTKHLPAGLGGADTQRILAKIDTLKGKAIPSALNTMRDINGKLGFRPSQVEVLGDAKGLLGALDHTSQNQADYIAQITANKKLILDQVRALDDDAVRNGYVSRGADGKLVPNRAPAARPVLTPKAGAPGKPTVSNW